ncbi:DUF2975 domain-containing protein [Nigerium massiliense]|uniref:DUF2975 domain-containing protein n=1 Tax=Nigerium massiliense TaxID=1522317 RepID=UPI00059144CC|nr:DUF2975 domain-containing protein [Nigerium massiliense]
MTNERSKLALGLATALRGLILALALGIACTMLVLIPVMASQAADAYPEVAYLRWPFVALLEVASVAGLVVLGSLWRLIALGRAGEFLSEASARPLGLATVSFIIAAATFLGIDAYLAVGLQAAPPLVFYGLLAGGLACLAAALVLRALLGQVRSAEAVKRELEEFV